VSVWRRLVRFRKAILAGALIGLFGIAAGGYWLWQASVAALRPVPSSFAAITAHVSRAQITDRHGRALNATYANDWNLHEVARLHEMPERVVNAFLEAEDQRFFEHGGPDWLARLRALGQNVLALRAVSGASTITEQVVRMINPRPRTLWSRWLEGWEAAELERAHGKLAVLEFYLNQVPYAANRRVRLNLVSSILAATAPRPTHSMPHRSIARPTYTLGTQLARSSPQQCYLSHAGQRTLVIMMLTHVRRAACRSHTLRSCVRQATWQRMSLQTRGV